MYWLQNRYFRFERIVLHLMRFTFVKALHLYRFREIIIKNQKDLYKDMFSISLYNTWTRYLVTYVSEFQKITFLSWQNRLLRLEPFLSMFHMHFHVSVVYQHDVCSVPAVLEPCFNVLIQRQTLPLKQLVSKTSFGLIPQNVANGSLCSGFSARYFLCRLVM